MGNILATITDAKIYQTNGSLAKVISGTDYYAFGAAMPSRSYQDAGYSKYRYGFNGKENDGDIGEGVTDFGGRLLNTKVGRWFNTDPKEIKNTGLSTYSFAGNTPISAIDPDGEDYFILIWTARPGDQGHAAIAIMNYEIVEKGKTKLARWDGTVTIYQARASGVTANDLEKFIKDPSMTLIGEISINRFTLKNKNINDLLGVKSGTDKANAVIHIESSAQEDINAKHYVKKQDLVTRFKPVNSIYTTDKMRGEAINPINYSLTEHKNEVDKSILVGYQFNCTSFVTFLTLKLYGDNFDAKEKIQSAKKDILYPRDLTSIIMSIPDLNLTAQTPNRLFRNLKQSANTVIKRIITDGSDVNLLKPFINAVTNDKIKDKKPNE